MSGQRKNVVITGSTRGIGQGMALEFAKRGHNVVISGRSQKSVDHAITQLEQTADEAGAVLVGVPCNVTDFAQTQNLWEQAVDALGGVDIWINNAGVTHSSMPIAKLPVDEIETVVHINLLGLFYGSQVALRGMKDQGYGTLYNFEGFGSNGMQGRGSAIYGSTKNALRYFTECLVKETKGTKVMVGFISPGMVTTELLLKDRSNMPPQAWARVQRIFNILADHVETVTPWLVDQVLANRKHGARIAWLTRRKSFWRFLKSRFVKRDLFTALDKAAAGTS